MQSPGSSTATQNYADNITYTTPKFSHNIMAYTVVMLYCTGCAKKNPVYSEQTYLQYFLKEKRSHTWKCESVVRATMKAYGKGEN